MISIIIVGYNSECYLDDCLSSVFKSSYKKFNVIFVDNCSKDGSIEYIKKNFPKVIVIQSNENLGFSGGNNIGIKEAMRLQSDYIFLLNPDTIVDEYCLERLHKQANANTIFQPLILLHRDGKKTELINTSGNYLNFLGFSYVGDYEKSSDEVKDSSIPLASGAGALIPVSAFKRAGYFDEDFFMYHEDVDLFWRFRSAGYDIRLVSDARMWHKYSFGRNKNKMFLAERNRHFFILKNYQLKTILLFMPALIINEIFVLVWSVLTGWFFLKAKSWINILATFPHIIKKRKAIYQTRKNQDKELVKYIGSEINFTAANIPLLNVYSYILKIYWLLIKRMI